MTAAREAWEAVGTGSLALTGGAARGLAPPAVASVGAKGEAVA